MEILGRGMIARALHPYQTQFPDVVAFARGVSNSSEHDPAAYKRECDLLIDAIHHCKAADLRLIYFSSGGTIYGDFPELRTEDSPTLPNTVYGRQQLLCEAMIRGAGVRHCIVRLANLVGDDQNPHQLIPALVKQAVNGKATLYKNATRDLLDVEGFARILARVLETLVHDQNEIVTIASGQAIPVIDLFAEIQRLLNTDAAIDLLDKGDIQRFSIEKLRRLLDDDVVFEPHYFRRVIAKHLKAYDVHELRD